MEMLTDTGLVLYSKHFYFISKSSLGYIPFKRESGEKDGVAQQTEMIYY